jgi:DNA (cytosine-5)-methyltransferase 1
VNELALFAGAGGGILGGKLLGWRTVCAVEWEAYPASVLCARQNDGLLEAFPIWDDVQTFDGKPWAGIVDVVSGGFPCQDISAAGKGAGIDGERSGMWGEMARIIHEVRPRFVFVENSPMLTSRGLGRVLGDLASMGFDAKWGVLGAADVGANHQRDRIWIVAKWRGQLPHIQHNRIRRWEQQQESLKKEVNVSNSCEIGKQWKCSIQTDGCSGSLNGQNNAKNAEESTQMAGISNMANPSLSGFAPCNNTSSRPQKPTLEKQLGGSGYEFGTTKYWWEIEPNVGRVVDGLAARVDRLKAIGNGQVSLCAAIAWRILSES